MPNTSIAADLEPRSDYSPHSTKPCAPVLLAENYVLRTYRAAIVLAAGWPGGTVVIVRLVCKSRSDQPRLLTIASVRLTERCNLV